MFKEAEAAPVGSTLDVRITSAPDRPYLMADAFCGMSAFNGDVELAIHSIQGHTLTQKFTVMDALNGQVRPDGTKAKAVFSGAVDSDNAISEVAVLRFTRENAMNAAAVLVEQSLKSSPVIPSDLPQRFADLFKKYAPQ